VAAEGGEAEFEANRPRLLGLAYRMLGEAAEAEDVLQDAYLRWARSPRPDVPAAWLTRVVTNLCLSRLGSARARRESYVGAWLPEPVLTDGGSIGPMETAEQRDSVSLAVLVLLERLTPPQRAAFVLREAFGYSHAEVADAVGTGEAHARQLYRRAREHVGEPRQRFTASAEHRDEIVRRFLAAAMGGDVEALQRLLADDAVSYSDGGGKASAARHPVAGREKVLRLLAGLARHPRAAAAEMEVRTVNGEPALLVREGGSLSMVMTAEVGAEGRVVALRSVRNPDKLAFAARQV
jgi:RNA polymerase sigma-70 factor (ECF subfamily)